MERRENRLARETSPYLLQHRHNPVDWHPWGPEALEKARSGDRPIFLSIGYAACHWCHVMERESFEDEATAAILNAHFVPIKVDREERPDLDEIYMTAVQLLTGQGGWPLNVFLTPDRRPFYGGTYWPPEDRWGRPGFPSLLRRIAEVWREQRTDVDRQAEALTAQIRAHAEAVATPEGEALPGPAEAARAAAELAGRFDPTWGGFGSAPKFPPHGGLGLLLREHARTGEPVPLRMAVHTLDRMALGGIYDQVGGGFARYSTDERWLTPHFEKMLYDQALLVPVYVDAWLLTGKPLYARIVRETLDFVRRELTDPSGGFWSSLDADSEGHEGKFYLWTPDEVRAVLGEEEGAAFGAAYDITPTGNFEGASIPNLAREDESRVAALADARARLLQAREGRVRPGTDDKVLASWNGLMVTAFARAFQALGRAGDLEAARAAARFLLGTLRGPDGRLRVTWRSGGEARLPGYLDDHAFAARALVDLYECDFDPAWLEEGRALAGVIVERFRAEDGGFFFTADDHEPLLARTRSVHDGALPAGSGVAVEALLRLAVHLDDPRLREAAIGGLRALHPEVRRHPAAFTALLAAAAHGGEDLREMAIVGPGEAMLDVVRGTYLPARAVARTAGPEGDDRLPLLRGKRAPAGGGSALYLCRAYACQAPITDPAEARRRLAAR